MPALRRRRPAFKFAFVSVAAKSGELKPHNRISAVYPHVADRLSQPVSGCERNFARKLTIYVFYQT